MTSQAIALKPGTHSMYKYAWPALQMENQLSAESLQLLRVPPLQQPISSQPAHESSVSMPAAATTHVPTPARRQESVTAYMPTPDRMMQSQQKVPTFPSTMMQSTLVRSNSLSSLPWGPTVGSARLHKNDIAPHPTLRPISIGNPVCAASNVSQQAHGVQINPQRNLSSNVPFGMSFTPGNNPSHLYSQSVEMSAGEAAAREDLMLEAAKSEHAFNPDHAAQLARLTGHMVVQRASSDPTLFRTSVAPSQTMQDILGLASDWQTTRAHHQQARPQPSLLQIPTLDCSLQSMNSRLGSFQHTPMQHLNEHMSSGHGYSHH